MTRRLFAFLLFAAICVSSTATSVTAAPRPSTVNPTAARIVELVNMHRRAAGLAPVTVHAVLMAEAQRFSQVQAQMGRLSHGGTDGSTAGQRLTRAGYRWRFYGENLAAGQKTPEAVIAGWMASPGHRANIMNPQAREIGIGQVVRADDPSNYFTYWVMELGRRR